MGEKGAEAAGPVPGSPGASLFVDSLENSPFSANAQATGELGAETIPTRAPSPGTVAGSNAGLNAGASDTSDRMNYAPPGGANYAPPGGGNLGAPELPADLAQGSDS